MGETPVSCPQDCPADCGVTLVTDERACLVANCDCAGCPTGQFFDENSLQCEACPQIELSCAEGCSVVGVTEDNRGCGAAACLCEEVCKPAVLSETGECEPCEEPTVPDCDPGNIESGTDSEGCPQLSCCPSGSFIGDSGRCEVCPESNAPEACQSS